MRRMVCAGIVAVSLCGATARPARAWGGGILFGTAVGVAAGTVIGSALVHPYPYFVGPPIYAYPPPYAYAYPLPYGVPLAYGNPPPYAYPAPYPAPCGTAYPAPAPRPIAGHAPPGSPAGLGYAANAGLQRAPATPACGTGQFFNTLTATCDRR